MAWFSFAASGFGGRGKLERGGFAVGCHPLGDFVPMDGNLVRCFDAEPHFVAGHAEDFDADAERREDDFVVASAGENEHGRTP